MHKFNSNMTDLGSQKRNHQSSFRYTDTAHSSCVVIETAVPLSNEFHHSISPDEEQANYQECQQQQQGSDSAVTISGIRWNLHLSILGIAAGMFVTGISYAALEMLLINQYRGGDDQQSDADATYGHVVQYAILKVLSHLGDLFFVLICLGFAWILTSSGNSYAQRWFLRRRENGTFLINDKYDESDSVTWNSNAARDMFVAIVYLEGGFLIGASFMGLIADILLSMPVSFFGFGSALALDVVVCSLLILCYDQGLVNIDSREENAQPTFTQDEEQQWFYIQIV